MEIYEVNFIIICQFPPRIGDILSTIDYSDSERISKAVARLDLSGGWNQGRNRENVNPNSSHGKHNSNNWENKNLSTENNSQNNRGRNDDRQKDFRENYRKTVPNNNWRARENRQYDENNEKTGRINTSQGANNTDRDKVHRSAANVRTLQITKKNEFLEMLCWDVEPEAVNDRSEKENRDNSPRIVVKINSDEYNMLIDTGSEVTCISETFYQLIKNDTGLL